MSQINLLFQQAVQDFQQGYFDKALKLGLRVQKKDKRNPDILHLLALIYKAKSRPDLAKKYFEQSLKSQPLQAVTLSNYANLLVEINENRNAVKYYSKAIKLDPQLLDAWLNLAILLNAQEDFEGAIAVIQKALKHHASVLSLYQILGIAKTGVEDYTGALSAFDRIIGHQGVDTTLELQVLRNKTVALREAHASDEAVTSLNRYLENKKIQAPELLFDRACAKYDIGDLESAEKDLLQSIRLNPAYVPAHEALNKLYWENSGDGEFLQSYEYSLDRDPDSAELYFSYIAQLILSRQYEKANTVATRAVHKIGKQANLIHAQGIIANFLNDPDASISLINQAISLQPENSRFRIDKANYLIRQQEYKAALQELNLAGKVEPYNQEIWSYKGICWRLQGDDRCLWLNDYKNFIGIKQIPCPDGYDDLEHFLVELSSVIARQHKTNRQPLDQSVKNGTQTVGRLLNIQNTVIQDYRKVITQSIQEYINDLPHDSRHPFLSRNTGKFRHAGSWSVKLKSGGYHSNHMHPQGWLSNCSYIEVPETIRPDDPDRAGWIKFGETSLQLGANEETGSCICPQAGMHVLFPSYFWHGTNPFNAESYRVTIPSDISPKPDFGFR
ncbi:MAG: tetratricopeptide repeat protein [Gammaproteobacteria bacterium]|nr:tetratricopeptide repeat protein [Gammaproteobacteria bacterium]NNC97400.1 tetratricopeptide repeat protein [Gammaproteobacteria bacterium]NNM14457.1 tetratricopeptide repeat protein [Gammaproteobacteria bacterium]